MYFTVHNLILISTFLVRVCGIVIPDKRLSKYSTFPNQHQIKKVLPQNRQTPQKCDLICPGVPPLSLPPNFIQNCSSIPNNVTQKPGNSTTPRPTSTTTESGDESNETDESTEESSNSSTKKSTGTSRKKGATVITKHRKNIQLRDSGQERRKSQLKKHWQNQNEKHFRKEKVLLKRQLKKEILKHKHFKGRNVFRNCYVVCADENQSGSTGNNGDQGGSVPGGTATDESGSEESDGDQYVEGEDTPIEIIYMPGSTKGKQRPVDPFQTNYYALLETEPAFEYGYPFFVEEKQKEVHKIKQKRKKDDKSKKNRENRQ